MNLKDKKTAYTSFSKSRKNVIFQSRPEELDLMIKGFGKPSNSFFLNPGKGATKMTLIEKDEVITDDSVIADKFNHFFFSFSTRFTRIKCNFK